MRNDEDDNAGDSVDNFDIMMNDSNDNDLVPVITSIKSKHVYRSTLMPPSDTEMKTAVNSETAKPRRKQKQ
jgi:hypothetical protein